MSGRAGVRIQMNLDSISKFCLLCHVVSLDLTHFSMKWIYLYRRKNLKLFKFLKHNIMVSPTHCGIKEGLQLDNVNDCRPPHACRITAPV